MKILIVDDSELALNAMRKLLRGYRVLTAQDGDEAIEIAARELPDVIFIDLMLAFSNGLDLIETMRPMFPDCQLVLMTGHPSPELIHEAYAAGADGFLSKLDYGLLHVLLDRLLTKQRTHGR